MPAGLTGRDLYERWRAIWAEMLTALDTWDELDDDDRNAWAELAEQLARGANGEC